MVLFANQVNKNVDFYPSPPPKKKLLVRPKFDFKTLVYLQTDGTLMRLSSDYTGQPKSGKKKNLKLVS